jgi:hypothetical protein
MNSQNREFLYQGMQALLLGGGFSGSFHDLWHHRRGQRYGSAGQFGRALFR